jgi:hypothetical protein
MAGTYRSRSVPWLRSRAPGPPSFASMKMTPAFSSARCIASFTSPDVLRDRMDAHWRDQNALRERMAAVSIMTIRAARRD